MYFEILLDDQLGSGIDASTVGSDQITVTENGQMLIAGSDYLIGYDQGSGLLRLTPTSGEWRPDSVYEIQLLKPTVANIPAIADLAGNHIVPNRLTGDTLFSIVMPDVISDFGDAPTTYGTLVVNNGARHTSSPNQPLRLGDLVDGELDGATGRMAMTRRIKTTKTACRSAHWTSVRTTTLSSLRRALTPVDRHR